MQMMEERAVEGLSCPRSSFRRGTLEKKAHGDFLSSPECIMAAVAALPHHSNDATGNSIVLAAGASLIRVCIVWTPGPHHPIILVKH